MSRDDDPNSEPDASQAREALRAIYAEVDAEVARWGPVCRISGRCCRFEEYGHTLFVSKPEFDLLLAEAPEPSRPLDGGATCPWQDDRGRCSARDARPMGCRVYFCDPNFQEKAPEIAESGIAKLKRLADKLGLPWDYAPLHRHLHQAREEGRFPTAAASTLDA